jgi:MFS family permease
MFVIAIVGLASFVVVELRSRVPMVDFGFFRSRTFAGANIVAFIVSFAMLAMFFFLALYMQNIRGFSPLEAGIRFLPATMMIIVVAPLAGRLADRVGSRPLMTFGLLAVSGSLFWQSHLTVSSGYGTLLPGFVLMGIGMGFVMSPMSLAAMNSVDQAKAGVASGILSMNRMVGGTFGVAVLGAMVSTLGRSQLDRLLPALPASDRARLASGLGSGGVLHGVSSQIVDASQRAFVYALQYGLRLGAAVALLGALLAWVLVARRPAPAGAGEIEQTPLERTDLAFLEKSLEVLEGGLVQVERGGLHRDLPVAERARLLALGQQTLDLVQHLKLQLEQADLEHGSNGIERGSQGTARDRVPAAGPAVEAIHV